jgi:hypothetical protein
MTCHRAAGALQFADRFHQSGIRLQFAVRIEIGSQFL